MLEGEHNVDVLPSQERSLGPQDLSIIVKCRNIQERDEALSNGVGQHPNHAMARDFGEALLRRPASEAAVIR